MLLVVYWAAYALVVPVTIWDSHAYNLARLLIANHGGLFGNTGWNSDRQVAFPWSFDAVHYPFLFLGWGYALPSFACFVGVMLIVFRVVKTRYNERTAWYCCLAMLALPTVLFQASSTKNDLGMVFGVACWFYAMWRYQQEKLQRFLALGAIGLSFAAGAKTFGLFFFAALSAYTVWLLRYSPRLVARFVGFSLVSFILLGSVEIYVNNQRTFGNLIGSPHIASHRNADGFNGTVANLVRYVIGSTDIGLDVGNRQSPFAAQLETVCRSVLKLMHLENVGYRPDFNDANLQFVKTEWESTTDFGPLGTLSLWMAVYMLLQRPARDDLRRICMAGLLSLLLLCATVGWMPWNMRFLMLPFLLFTLATTIFLTGPEARGLVGQRVFLLLALGSAILFPLYSFNKSPRDLWRSVTMREWMTVKERPGMAEIIDDVDGRHELIGQTPVVLSAGGNSWVLPILQMRDLRIIPSPIVDLSLLRNVASRHHTQSVYILLLNQDRPIEKGCAVSLVKKYGEADSGLYIWSPDVSPTPDRGSPAANDLSTATGNK